MHDESDPHCISSGDLIETLASFELFHTVDRPVLDELCPSLQWLMRRGGEVLFDLSYGVIFEVCD